MNEDSKKIFFNLNPWFTTILFALIFIGLLTGIIIAFRTNIILSRKIAKAQEIKRPANIDVIILKASSCQDCFDLKPILNLLKKENIKVNSERTVEITSQEGGELIKKFDIINAPTFLLSGEIDKHSSFKDLLTKIGEIKDATFILRQTGTPYLEINSGIVRGRVKLILLSDSNCSECYDVNQHQEILKQFGLNTLEKKIIDAESPEGKELIGKYQIEFLPTIILIGDIEVYPSLKSVWPQVGTVEEDGAYVFREGVKQMGTYRDLTTSEIIKPKEAQQ